MKKLENILDSVKNFGKAVLFTGALAVSPLIGGCGDDNDNNNEENHNPVIQSIEDQAVQEGESFNLDLSSYISDPDGDPLTTELVSGPGTIINNQFSYQDQRDDDIDNNSYLVEFRVTDGKEGEASGSFNLTQQDNYSNNPPVVQSIPQQFVNEGELFSLDFNNYITDPDGDTFTVELTGSMGTIIDNILYHQDEIDTNNVDEIINTFGFKVTDSKGLESGGNFMLRQIDVYAPPIDVTPETLTSGLEALIIGADETNIGTYRRNQTSIAVNSKDEPLILYFQNFEVSSTYTMDLLKYVEQKDGLWGGAIITGFWWPCYYNSVIIDPQDKAHVAFTIFTEYHGEDLYYATNQNGSWEIEHVDGNDSVGLENSIALDSLGNVHISHWAWNGKDLKYSTNDSGEWVNDILDEASWQQTSIALDSQDSAHIAYVKNSLLYYMTNELGSWENQGIHSSINPFLYIDSNDLVNIISRGTYSIYHSTKQSNNWQTQEVINHNPAYILYDCILSGARSNDDSLMIAYIVSETDGNSFLGKPYFATNKGGSWQRFLLDNRPIYTNPSIAVDSNGHAHISVIEFIEDGKGIVKYITFDPSQL